MRAFASRNGLPCSAEIVREKRGAVLIDHLAFDLVREFDRGKPPPDALDQNGNADVSDHRADRVPDRAHDVGGQPVIREPRVNGRNVNRLCRARGGSRHDLEKNSPRILGRIAGIAKQ